MKLERQQILSLFIKVMKKFYKHLYGIASKEIESVLPRLKEVQFGQLVLPMNSSFTELQISRIIEEKTITRGYSVVVFATAY